jgi:hypothetical protein
MSEGLGEDNKRDNEVDRELAGKGDEEDELAKEGEG